MPCERLRSGYRLLPIGCRGPPARMLYGRHARLITLIRRWGRARRGRGGVGWGLRFRRRRDCVQSAFDSRRRQCYPYSIHAGTIMVIYPCLSPKHNCEGPSIRLEHACTRRNVKFKSTLALGLKSVPVQQVSCSVCTTL